MDKFPEFKEVQYCEDGGIDCKFLDEIKGWRPTKVDEHDRPDWFAHIVATYDIAPFEDQEVSDAERALKRPQFAFLLALTGFDEVWDGLETVLKDANRVQYAALKAERSRDVFRLDRTLEIVAQFATAAAQIAPDVDLSEGAIRAAWAQAETFTGAG